MNLWCSLLAVAVLIGGAIFQEATAAENAQPTDKKLRALIIDGNNPYHEWQKTTPLLKKILEESGRFEVDVVTLPIKQRTPQEDMKDFTSGAAGAKSGSPQTTDFRPKFSDYDVVVSNYIGPRWPAETEADFAAYVAGGGGFVSVHAADNAFPDWPEYNRITGLGGWYGRNESWGPYVYYDDDMLVRDEAAGSGGHHGPQHEYQVRVRDREHPITRGLPEVWMHAKDELYEKLRGPAENLHVLATAYASPDQEGSGRHEPVLMTVDYGNGRVFHTVLGHADYSMQCVGFATTLARGAEWATTGEVTIPVPDDFPTGDKSLSRD